MQTGAPNSLTLTLLATEDAEPGTYTISVVGTTGFGVQKTVNLTLLVRSGAAEITPIVLIVVILIGVISVISFILIPRGRHTHVVRVKSR